METTISAVALRRAASIKDQIELLEAEYRAIITGETPPARRGPKPGSKRGPKPGRKPGRPAKSAIEAPSAAPAAKKAKKKRKMSPEARARIVAAVKARWAREKGKA